MPQKREQRRKKDDREGWITLCIRHTKVDSEDDVECICHFLSRHGEKTNPAIAAGEPA